MSPLSGHRRSALARFVGTFTIAALCALAFNPIAASPADTLRQVAAERHINIGAAAASAYLADPRYASILGSEFSQLQAENEMKFGLIHPRPDTDANPYHFADADALVAFAQSHAMLVRGHTLVWHNQVSPWVTKGGFTAPQLATILRRPYSCGDGALRLEGLRVGCGQRSLQ